MDDKDLAPNRFNTWDSVRETRKDLIGLSDEYGSELEDTWKDIKSGYGDLVKRDDDERSADSPLGSFMHLVELGFYPPPEVLMAVYQCFDHYFRSRGRLELEEVFFSGRKKGIGNHAAQKIHDSLYRHLWFREQVETWEKVIPKPKRPLHLIASEMLEHLNIDDDDLDLDSFLRSYRRWKHKGD